MRKIISLAFIPQRWVNFPKVHVGSFPTKGGFIDKTGVEESTINQVNVGEMWGKYYKWYHSKLLMKPIMEMI